MSETREPYQTLPEQIKSQADQPTVELRIMVAGQDRRITVTREQADAILSGAELFVDPLTGSVTVRE